MRIFEFFCNRIVENPKAYLMPCFQAHVPIPKEVVAAPAADITSPPMSFMTLQCGLGKEYQS
jgi:hypothetical protein